MNKFVYTIAIVTFLCHITVLFSKSLNTPLNNLLNISSNKTTYSPYHYYENKIDENEKNFILKKKCPPFFRMTSQINVLKTSSVESSIYQTPTIFNFFHDNNKELLVPTFVRYVDVIESDSGASAPGWPFSSQQISSHASALLYDIDEDGQVEMVYSTLDAQIIFLKQDGSIVSNATLRILPAPIRKFWYEGIDIYNEAQEKRKRNDDAFISLSNIWSSPNASPSTSQSNRNLLALKNDRPIFGPGRMPEKKKSGVSDGWLSKEARKSIDDFFTPSSMLAFLENDYEDKSNIFYSNSYEQAYNALKNEYSQKIDKDSIVFVDPHILSTPVIIDIDHDGNDEIIVGVSYFFDREYYSNPDHQSKLDTDVDLSMYVAGSIVVQDIKTGKIKWTANLDLSSDKTKLRGYVYGSPTVADLDSDGNLEIIIGTSQGFVYVFDKNGTPKEGFPIIRGEVQGQVFVNDINRDGDMELCVCDFDETISCYNSKGKMLWETKSHGSAAQVPTMGDVNGDGILELVFGTNKGYIYAVRGDNGEILKSFPVKTGGSIYAPILITDLYEIPNHNHPLQLVVPSFDGNVYIIDGNNSFCLHKIDIGEKSYSQVLVDDFVGSGKMQLIVSTMNGNIFILNTQGFYHTLKTQTEQYHSTNGFSYRYRYHGIHITKGSRKFRDIIGNTFKLAFVITDKRSLQRGILRHYHVKISIGRNVILKEFDYDTPGTYLITLPTPKMRMHATVTVEMLNEHGQIFRDDVAISFNIGFLRIIKWALVAPLLAMIIALFTLKRDYKKKVHLPSG